MQIDPSSTASPRRLRLPAARLRLYHRASSRSIQRRGHRSGADSAHRVGESAIEADMEMPEPEGLEWMSSHGLLPEEEDDAYFDDPDAGFFPPPATRANSVIPCSRRRPPAKPADEASEGRLKRPPPPPALEQEEDERNKRRNVERDDSGD